MNLPCKRLFSAAALLCAAGAHPLFAGNERPARGEEALAAVKADPGDREALLRAVELLQDSPRAAAALEASARRLLEKDPADYAGYLALCKSLRGAGRAPEAVSNCRRALELDPTAYPVYRELGLSYEAAGNPRKAAETLEQGLELSSSSYKASYDLARLLENRGDPERALPRYRQAVSLADRSPGPDSDYYRALAKAGARRAGAAAETRQKPAARPKAKAAGAPPAKTLPGAADCLEKFKAEFIKDNLGAALAQSDACLKLAPASASLAAERAPLLVRLGRYEEGLKEYERAAGLYSSNASLAAFYRIKAAETLLKMGKGDKAVEQYRKALAANPSDLNALKGLAAAQEALSDTKGAQATYDALLKADPSDGRARARREELRSASLNDGEILEELRLRLAAPPEKSSAAPEDVKLFKAIRAAETAGAVDYVQARNPSGAGLIAQRKTGEGARLVLTAAGYKAYVFYATRDAIKFFEGEGVGLREIFKLRTLAGDPVFDAAGKLTPEGEELWRNSSRGEKTWLLPYDPVPTSPQAVQAEKEITEAMNAGYGEISEPEYLWLLKVTTCPDDVMKAPPLSVKEFKDGAKARYFICYKQNSLCVTDENSKLPQLVAQYRDGEPDMTGGGAHTGFFGGPASKKRHFCENGRIWRGE
ncbi:MAG: tetratricopeptide repeat protein [Elusimicrobiales bacterium]|nr:tetratricopeptide repeat protein [Elusimicrobiales bacterium]